MGQSVGVQERHGETEFVRDLSDVFQRVGAVVVVLEKVKYALPCIAFVKECLRIKTFVLDLT